MATTSTRVFIDCSEMPSDSNCTLKISGTPEEVEKAAVAHAIAVHGHSDTPELHEQIKAGFKAEASLRSEIYKMGRAALVPVHMW